MALRVRDLQHHRVSFCSGCFFLLGATFKVDASHVITPLDFVGTWPLVVMLLHALDVTIEKTAARVLFPEPLPPLLLRLPEYATEPLSQGL